LTSNFVVLTLGVYRKRTYHHFFLQHSTSAAIAAAAELLFDLRCDYIMQRSLNTLSFAGHQVVLAVCIAILRTTFLCCLYHHRDCCNAAI